jgi:hypothetical protein
MEAYIITIFGVALFLTFVKLNIWYLIGGGILIIVIELIKLKKSKQIEIDIAKERLGIRKKLSKKQIEKIKKKYGYECAVCRRDECLEIHHRDSNPANNQDTNLIPLCHSCHLKTRIKV